MKASLSGAFQDGERSTDVLVRGPVTITTGRATQHAPVPAALADRPGGRRRRGRASRRGSRASPRSSARDGKPVDDLSGGAAPSGAAWAADERLNPFELVAGRAPRGADEVVVDRSTADAADLSVGDRTSVLTGAAPQDMTVVGIATFAGQDNRAGNRTRAVQRRHGRPAARTGRPGRRHRAAGRRRGRARPSWRSGSRPRCPAGDQAITGTALAEENGERANEDVTFFSLFMTVFAVVALLVGAFIISNTFSILVAQRTRELALLRAIGASAPPGTPVGAARGAGRRCGRVCARAVRRRRRGPRHPGALVGARHHHAGRAAGRLRSLAGDLVRRRCRRDRGVGSAAGPPGRPGRPRRGDARGRGRAGAGLPPARRHRPGAHCRQWRSRWCSASSAAWFRWCCWVRWARCSASPPWRRCWPDRWSGCSAALLPRLVGIRGLLARENAVRNPRRTAATASALMIGVALVGSITVVRGVGQALGHRVVRPGVPRRPRGRVGRLDVRRREPRAEHRAEGPAGGCRRGASTVHPGPGGRQLG